MTIMLRNVSILCIIFFIINSAYAVDSETTMQSSFSASQIVINTANPAAKPSLDTSINTKVVVVDVESVFEHSIAVKDLKLKINKLGDEMQNEMSGVEVELKKVEAELIKKRGSMSHDEFDQKNAEFNKKVSEAQKLLQSRKAALEQARVDGITIVQNTIVSIVEELSQKHGFNLALPINQVIFVDDKLNITLEVITHLNKKLTNIEVKYDANHASLR